ncbi:hypothetical protein GOP47_0016873 [Adiantum capillus-veneris]|uniref:Uncharacterized protein n=1 Tax=Adiantum capillus-veneris TaxID=13818 RepID=A0A9D4ZAQ8_ADICA|nr:hypothetical protein GOP47_0016873 [Adiantum capillus-veneris]
MDCFPLDWKCIDGSFEKDDFYETIQAPKWIDFSAPLQPVDDHAWFCGRVGCTHEKKFALQVINQERRISTQASNEPALVVVSVAIPTARIGISNNGRPRRVFSSSLSSLASLRATYARDKVAYHRDKVAYRTQLPLPSIEECKGVSAKSVRRQLQESENENPNRTCKGEEGALKKSSLLRGAEAKEKKSKISTASSRNLSEQISLSQTGPMLEARTFVFGERNATHAKSMFNRGFRKDATSVSASVSGAKSLKGRGMDTISLLQPTARNSHLTNSSVMPLRKSTTKARHLNSSVVGGAGACKPRKLTKDVKVAVNSHACIKISDCKEEATSKQLCNTLKGNKHNVYASLPLKFQELQHNKREIQIKRDVEGCGASTQKQHTQREEPKECVCGVSSLAPLVVLEQEGHSAVQTISNSLLGGEDEGVSNDFQTREEDSIQNTLETFLENLRLSSHEEEAKLYVENCTSKQRLGRKDLAESPEQSTKQDFVNEQDPTDCTTVKFHGNDNVHPLYKEIVGEHDQESALEQEMEQSMRCSSFSEVVSSLNGMEMAALQTTSNVVIADNSDQIASTNKVEVNAIINQKQGLKVMKDGQRCRGTKRKSSELNLRIKHATRDHRRETQMVPLLSQPTKQSVATAKLHVMACGSKDSWKMKTTIAPFRLRTEERGALRGLKLAKKEPRAPLARDSMHCALRMPTFGHPFRPQRSLKKLTIPKEPKFLPSKARIESRPLN